MPIQDDKKKSIESCIVRLVKKNVNALILIGTSVSGLDKGDVSKQLASKVFGFDPQNVLPLDDLVLESLLNGLAEEDIVEIFKRYAQRKGLKF